MIPQHSKPRFWIREPFCGLSHLLGAVASVIGCLFLLHRSAGQPVYITAGCLLYGVSLIALYTASGLYHSVWGTPRTMALLQRLDHSAIFLLIAGTFAPLCLITLHGPLGWLLLTVEYMLTLVGVVLVLGRLRFPHALRVATYLVMGWLSVLVFGPLQAALPAVGMVLYVAGGLFYSVGTVIFALDRPHLLPGRFSAHDLWHLFVLAGSACHFALISVYVVPTSAP